VGDNSDQARFTEVFMPNLVDAFRLASWLAGNRADAEDMVQEASIRAFKNIRGFSGGDPRAVLTIVRNTSYSWLAKNRPKVVVLSEDLNQGARERIEREATDETRTPEAAPIAKLEAQHVRKAMASLPAPFREVLVLTNSAARAASGGDE
jgi:RNA polymerase sigma factor (sigma-70 family)